jgi:hypothetical protein
VQPQDPEHESAESPSVDLTVSEKSSDDIDVAIMTDEPLINHRNEESHELSGRIERLVDSHQHSSKEEV